jgi:uncharacterized protein (DUF305 family)
MTSQALSRTTRSVVLMVAAVFALSSCSLTFKLGPQGAPGGATDSSARSGEFTQNELMFASMMIPHHEQAVEMSELALQRSTDERVLDLANRIAAGQEPEIVIMQAWLDASGDSDWDGHMGGAGGNHMGHGGMGGMASASELRQLATLDSPEFDALFLELMIEHHDGAIDMVRMISGSKHPEVSALASDIVRVQQEEIAEMENILGSIRAG